MKVKFALVSLFLLTVTSLIFAANNKKSVTFTEPVTVAGVVLQPGDYVVEWSGTDSDVQVTFFSGKNKLVTAPAKLVPIDSRYDAITLRPDGSGSSTLVEIDSKHSALRFVESDASGE